MSNSDGSLAISPGDRVGVAVLLILTPDHALPPCYPRPECRPPIANIRNISVVAYIDQGMSTLAVRLI